MRSVFYSRLFNYVLCFKLCIDMSVVDETSDKN